MPLNSVDEFIEIFLILFLVTSPLPILIEIGRGIIIVPVTGSRLSAMGRMEDLPLRSSALERLSRKERSKLRITQTIR